ncbi:hypothetical protein D3C87_1687360 [compost metagenome]
MACHDSSSSPSRLRCCDNWSVLGKSCMVLSQARRLPVIRCTMNRRQARAAAMALMKLPTIMRGIDSTACSQPYMWPTK